MVFSSIPFLFYFLPAVLILYFAAPNRLKNFVLFLMSMVFYAWGEPRFALVMLFTIAQGYAFGLLIERCRGVRAKVCLAASLTISLGLLGYCKYADFFIASVNAATGLSLPLLKVTLPIGISFYTFQILSYTVDVYRGDVPAQRNFIDLGAYIAMFPQLIAGPIVRYSHIAGQLRRREHSLARAALGLRRFALGLGKKVLIANVLAQLVNSFRASGDPSVLFYWLYACANALQIYFDFSGYSDMAIGLGKLFGFDFLENFDHPFISKSATEFWRRWHISLGSWFRDYVYIPLGGNRCGRAKQLRNILVVWLLTGLWHGAAWSFVVWGLFFALLLIVEKLALLKYLERSRVLSRVYLLLAVLLSFLVFSAASLREAGQYLAAMFGFGGLPAASAEALYCLRSYGVVFLIAIVGSTPLLPRLIARLRLRPAWDGVLNAAEPLFLLALLAVCTGSIVNGSFNPFLYFRF